MSKCVISNYSVEFLKDAHARNQINEVVAKTRTNSFLKSLLFLFFSWCDREVGESFIYNMSGTNCCRESK